MKTSIIHHLALVALAHVATITAAEVPEYLLNAIQPFAGQKVTNPNGYDAICKDIATQLIQEDNAEEKSSTQKQELVRRIQLYGFDAKGLATKNGWCMYDSGMREYTFTSSRTVVGPVTLVQPDDYEKWFEQARQENYGPHTVDLSDKTKAGGYIVRGEPRDVIRQTGDNVSRGAVRDISSNNAAGGNRSIDPTGRSARPEDNNDQSQLTYMLLVGQIQSPVV